MNNLCLGWACDTRDRCKRYIPNVTIEEGYTRYFLPFQTGEFCEHYLSDANNDKIQAVS